MHLYTTVRVTLIWELRQVEFLSPPVLNEPWALSSCFLSVRLSLDEKSLEKTHTLLATLALLVHVNVATVVPLSVYDTGRWADINVKLLH